MKALLPALLLACASTQAAECTAIDDDRVRLACYDALHSRQPPPIPAAGASAPAVAARAEPAPRASGTWLAKLWDLDAADRDGALRLRPHQANYLLPARFSDRPNANPLSPAPDHALAAPVPLDHTEAKFQLSFKFKVVENVFGDNGDVWFGYTQQSNWQLYNRGISEAFRESDYEPEAILTWRTQADVLGWRWRLLNLGFVHQSNGRALPLSRSWNRVYAAFGLERGRWALVVRPWVRLHDAEEDDNPDLVDYMGHGDVRLTYLRERQAWSALLRYAGNGRGFAQLDWAFPVLGHLNAYVQLTTGYGESLIDYNHRQTTLGAGILLLPWQ